MNTWSAAVLIARKDLNLYRRDRTGLLLGLLLPIVLVAVFGSVMKFAFGGEGGMPRVTIWVCDEDGSATSQKFVAALREVSMLSVQPRVKQEARTAASLRSLVQDGEAHHALVLGKGFGEALANASEPPLTLIRDPGRHMEGRLVGIGLMQAMMSAGDGSSMSWMRGSLMRRNGMGESEVKRLVAGMEAVQNVIGLFSSGVQPVGKKGQQPAPGGNANFGDMASMFDNMVPVTKEDVSPPARPKNLGYQLAQSVSGMTVMMLMFGLMACSSMLLVERDQGTLRRLLVSRAPRHAVLLGKFLFCFIVGMLQLIVLFAFGEVVFSIGAFRDPMTLLALSVTWAAAATSFGILISVWAKTTKQAEGVSTLLILVMAALGGCWFPIQMADLPWYGEVLTRSTLTFWAMEGFQGMFWHQKSWTDPVMLRAMGVLWGFVVIASGLSWRLWRRRFVGT
jgi:ABC-2 type transport system permease protein